MERRKFIKTRCFGNGCLYLSKIRLGGVISVGGRGRNHVKIALQQQYVEIIAICYTQEISLQA